MSISDAILLIKNYGNYIYEFPDSFILERDKISIRKELNLAEVIAHGQLVGSKKGNEIYNTWKSRKTSMYTDLINRKEKTVFEKLKENNEPFDNTVFRRLKRIKYGI